MDNELDDIMDQFLEMERELSGMPATGETDTVKLRKKMPPTVSSTPPCFSFYLYLVLYPILKRDVGTTVHSFRSKSVINSSILAEWW